MVSLDMDIHLHSEPLREDIAAAVSAPLALPLVSCIMPTYNRRIFVGKAIEYFLKQDYSQRELVILDDGDDRIEDLVPDAPSIRYISLPERMRLGAKRNAAIAASRGEIIIHWDDDDWMGAGRITHQVSALLAEDADICGASAVCFCEIASGQLSRYRYPPSHRRWLYGATLCYRRSLWQQKPFESLDIGEDTRFVWASPQGRMVDLAERLDFVAIVHSRNTSNPRPFCGQYWAPWTSGDAAQLLGADWAFYQAIQSPLQPICGTVSTKVLRRRPAQGEPIMQQLLSGEVTGLLASPDRSRQHQMPMMTTALECDLHLPEFLAFNHMQSLPRMRRWELPFALFQSRLDSTMAVFDCTINPVNFHDRLTRLYPDVVYRHWSPIQHGQFRLPIGFPDAAFDRVICVNTLEHLLTPQREALIAEIAGKLKPGGSLVLTADFYFDSFWQCRELLNMQLIRSDGGEVFNGFNKIRAGELSAVCRANGLFPVDEQWLEPSETDTGLYRQVSPYPHASIGGVFRKGKAVQPAIAKKIVLALLTWNTRDVSLDSVRAYIGEARMLRRLGYQPFLCVCDNGSTDGTGDAVRAVISTLEFDHHLIFNRTNLGNSIARNQIIDYMRAVSADYVLFLDGDIEIVPFSSFAMLRYMENVGRRLGCIGACSAGQSRIREQTSRSFYSIDRVEATNLVAWTQYGLFRREIFEDGVRFDEAAPFVGAGWGFEDNDLAFQMDVAGYESRRFFGMIYLHRDAGSSLRIMRRLGLDPYFLYEKRKRYVIDKWSNVPQINNGPLTFVRSVNLRF
jgi:glycosyltransferase involved in cell wall biosynthesis